MRTFADGFYLIDEQVSISGEGVSPFVFGNGWMLEIVDVESGEFYFFSDSTAVKPSSRRFAVFYPPFSIVRSYVKNLKGRVTGVGTAANSASPTAFPTIFETEFVGPFTSVAQASDVIRKGRGHRSIEPNTTLSLLTRRAKRLIDENYLAFPSIARIAERLNVSHAHMSRQFRLDLEMTPSEYLHHLRVADATFRLSLGQEIIDISHNVGYNDLSRFYKQFKKKTAASPASCRRALSESQRISKNAKTR